MLTHICSHGRICPFQSKQSPMGQGHRLLTNEAKELNTIHEHMLKWRELKTIESGAFIFIPPPTINSNCRTAVEQLFVVWRQADTWYNVDERVWGIKTWL